MNFSSYASLDVSTISRKGAAVLLPLLVLLLVGGRGSATPSSSQLLATRLLNIVPVYPRSVATNQGNPYLLKMPPKEQLVTASSKYLVPATAYQIEQWYLNELKSLGWIEAGNTSSESAETGATSEYEIEFTSTRYPLVSYHLSLQPLAQRKTLVDVMVSDAQTPRPASSYLSPSFDRAKVTIYTVTAAMVPKRTTMYSFLLKQTNKSVIRSYVVTNASVVHQWVAMLNAMPVAPRLGTVDCPSIGASTKLTQIVFSSSKNTGGKTVTVPTDCRGLPGVGSVTLWDATGQFLRTINSYPQPPQPSTF